jgi:multidrug resistance efflux pump
MRTYDMSPTTPHNGTPRRRWLTFVWLLGVATLAVSMAGAGWMMRTNAGPQPGASAGGGTANSPLNCLGHIDVESGVSFPYPVGPGRVVEVKVREGQAVKAGDVLFRMDDRTQREDLDRAENAVKAAGLKIDEADNARKKHAEMVQAQTHAVEAAERDVEAARLVHQRKVDLVAKKALVQEEADAAKKLVEKGEAAAKGESSKLAALKLDAEKIAIERRLAEADVADKKLLRDKAKLALDECAVTAPADGTVLRLDVRKGDLLDAQPKSPPLIFCPAGPRIVRAEVEQEWAGRVQEGQVATIEDDTANASGPKWTGKVVRVGEWMAHRRSILPDPSQFHDIRTLECIIALDPDQPPLRIGQRMRIALANP